MAVDTLSIECPFCGDMARRGVVATLGSVYAIRDLNPVTEGHLLIIPARHSADFFTMSHEEKIDAFTQAQELGEKIRKDDPSVLGFNLGRCCCINSYGDGAAGIFDVWQKRNASNCTVSVTGVNITKLWSGAEA